MAKYGAKGSSTASAVPRTALTIVQGATTVRAKLYDILMGCPATPADAQLTYTLQRFTAAGTPGTTPTPEPLDGGDAAANCTCGVAHTAEPTYAGASPLELPLHQRASHRWVARQGGEIVLIKTAANGYGMKKTAETSGTPQITVTMHWEE